MCPVIRGPYGCLPALCGGYIRRGVGDSRRRKRGYAGAGDGGRADGAGEGRGDGGRKAAKALVTTSERDANSYKAAGRPPAAVGRAVPAVGWITLRRVRIRCRFVAETGWPSAAT